MSTTFKHVPKHRAERAASSPPVREVRRRTLTSVAALSSVAVLATGLSAATQPAQPSVVTAAGSAPVRLAAMPALADQQPAPETFLGGLAVGEDPAALREAGVSPAELGERAPVVSRGDRRDATDRTKQQALAADDAPAMTAAEDVADQDPRTVARAMMGEFGFSSSEFGCLDSLWTKESGWDVHADNPTSSAYGIPQSLPGEKMATAGADWADNPATQIRWGLGYIRDSYGSPCSAWSHSQAVDWY